MSEKSAIHVGEHIPEFALTDPALILPTLFTNLRGDRSIGLNVCHVQTLGVAVVTHHFSSSLALSHLEQSVLLYLCAECLRESFTIEPHVTSTDIHQPISQSLKQGLQDVSQIGAPTIRSEAVSRLVSGNTVLVVKTSLDQVRKGMGLLDQSSKTYAEIRVRLERLAGIRCRIMIEDDCIWSSRLLSIEWSGTVLYVAFNRRLSLVMQQIGRGVHHARIDLRERGILKSALAQLAHAWLSVWIWDGRQARIGLDKLAARFYRSPRHAEPIHGAHGSLTQPASSGVTDKRRSAIAAALAEIKELPGWGIEIRGRGRDAQVTVSRGKRCVAARQVADATVTGSARTLG